MNELTANIFNIQTMSTEDGPGIRTNVFMKGCPLSCVWCQNPEGLTDSVHLVHDAARCIGCGRCVKNCPTGALAGGDSGLQFGPACRRCMTCAGGCPAAAIRVIGSRVGLAELVEKLLPDRPFYQHSGGGVTFSGGECLLQHRFLIAIIPGLRAEGIHVCVDTSGFAAPKIFQSVAAEADLVLYDLKLMDDKRHRALTGVSNKTILENAAWLGASGIPAWVRVPVVPGYTDGEENMAAIARFISERMPAVERVDLLGYNDLCVNDYEKLGLDYGLKGTGRVGESDMERLREIMEHCGVTGVTFSNYVKGV